MADQFDFNPDLTEVEEEPKKFPKIEVLPPDEPHKFQTVVTNSDSTVSYTKMVEMTKQHIADDKQVREEMQELTGILDDSMHQMSIKELLEYYKIKLKEREFHNKAIFDAYTSDTSFKKGNQVYVSIPMGNWNEQKLIVAKKIDNIN